MSGDNLTLSSQQLRDAVLRPVKTMFNSSLLFPPINNQKAFINTYREHIDTLSGLFRTPKWLEDFDNLSKFAFADEQSSVRSLVSKIEDNLNDCMHFRDNVTSKVVAAAERFSVIDNVDYILRESHELAILSDNLNKQLAVQISSLKELESTIEPQMSKLTEFFNGLGNDWIQCAEYILAAVSKMEKLSGNMDRWSELVDAGDRSRPLCGLFTERFTAFRAFWEGRLPAMLSQLARLCRNLKGNIESGATDEAEADKKALAQWIVDLRSWEADAPSWGDENEFSYLKTKKSYSGQIGLRPDPAGQTKDYILGDGTTAPHPPFIELMQAGIARFEIGDNNRVGLYLQTSRNSAYSGDMVWMPRQNVSQKFISSSSSWFQVPEAMWKDPNIKFGWTMLTDDAKPGQAPDVKFSNSSDIYQHAEDCDEHQNCWAWTVKYSQEFHHDTRVTPWIMDVSSENALRLTVSREHWDSFRIHVTARGRNQIRELKIGYVAYSVDGQNRPLAKGFHIFPRPYDPPRYKIMYHRFPDGKFQHRPAVALLMSRFAFDFNKNGWYHISARIVATSKAALIEIGARDDSYVDEAQFEVLAISND